MPCCQAEKYKWCKTLRSVKFAGGKEYCVFHAPEEHKGQTPESFNKLVYAKIQDAINKKKYCDLSGTIFPWSIAFSQFDKNNPFPKIYFIDVIFNEYVDFVEATFSEDAFFINATFNKASSFRGTTFRKEAFFKKATFRKPTGFIEAVFNEIADFDEVAFKGIVNFNKAVFSGAASFNKAIFSEDADFTKAAFNKVGFASFTKATFDKDVHFIQAAFSGDVKFTKATFNGDVHFRTTNFHKSLYLGWCLVNKSIFFEDVDLSKVSFLNSDPSKIHFTDCTWSRRYGRNILLDEKNLKKKVSSFDKVEYLYRRLKQKYKEEHNETEASNWHYGEKEMFRKKKWWRRYNPISFSNLYWISSGYGERPVRAGLVIVLLFVAVTILMNLLGLVPKHGNPVFGVESIKGFTSFFNPKKFWLLINNTVQHALFVRDAYFIPQNLAGSIILTLSTRLIMPIQTALFVLSLRNKFRKLNIN